MPSVVRFSPNVAGPEVAVELGRPQADLLAA